MNRKLMTVTAAVGIAVALVAPTHHRPELRHRADSA
jgi:hypothetical protein